MKFPSSLNATALSRAFRKNRRFMFLALLAAWGVALSGLAFAAVMESEQGRRRHDFEFRASDRIAALEGEMASHIVVLHSLQSFYSASEPVSRDNFGVYTRNELPSHPGIQALEWIPLVTAEQRPSFEAAMRAEGFAGFEILERQANGVKVAAGQRDEYFPVTYIEPYAGNEAALGFDVASSPSRLAALRKSRDTGKPVVTQRVVLAQEAGDQYGFLIFLPVYENGPPALTFERRRDSLAGFVAGVFRASDLTSHAWAGDGLPPLAEGTELFLFDRSAPADSQALVLPSGGLESGADARGSLTFARSMDFGGRTWEAIITAPKPSLLTIWQPWPALLAGLSLTVVALAYVVSAMQRDTKTRLLVDQRTRELSEANRLLEGEIIDRSKAQQEERRVLSIIEHSPDFIGVSDTDGRVIFVNEAGLALAGLADMEEARTHLMPEYIHPEDLPEFTGRILPTVIESTFWDGEIRFRNFKDGSFTLMRSSIFSTHDPATGALTGFATVSQDITERKIADDTLKEREARLRAIVDSAVDGIITVDGSGTLESFNPAAERIFGYSSHEVVGNSVDILMPVPCHGENNGYLKALNSAGETRPKGQGQEIFGLRKDGTSFPMELLISKVDLAGRLLYTGIVRDITASQALQREVAEYTRDLEAAYEELQTLDKMKDEFISTVSHELRTPLTSIKGAAEILLNYTDEDPAILAEFLGIIDSESDRLTRLINDVLDLARMESGQMEWSELQVDLPSVIETAIDGTHALTLRKNVTVEIAPGNGLPMVASDPDKLVQVITNLLSNAIKFTPSGGLIRVLARPLPAADSGSGTEMVEISISDNGIGIPVSEFVNIFDRFQQARTSLSDRPKGTGLGLAISKEIVTRLGGRIWVESEPEVGSTFFFTVPVDRSRDRAIV